MNKRVEKLVIDGVTYVPESEVAPLVLDDYCIVRTCSAGVFAGNLVERAGKEGVVENARRLWRWSGAASLSQLAVEGVKNPNDCKFAMAVPRVVLTEIIEVIPCTQAALDNIAEVPEWKN